jgi:23S rRNA (pseudouridine1915-N3)-methyltransferase
MKYRLVAVGKLREAYVERAFEDFRTRFARYEAFELIEVAAAHGGDPERAMREEGERVVRALDPSDVVWLLERTGLELSSRELALRLKSLADEGRARITFVVAGTYGASDALLERADFRWSLSRLTFLHEWARAIVLEQLYRSAKIVRNEPYHH